MTSRKLIIDPPHGEVDNAVTVRAEDQEESEQRELKEGNRMVEKNG